MGNTQANRDTGTEASGSATVPLRLEVVTVPVSDVDRAKLFYQGLGWRLDADFAAGDDIRECSSLRPTHSARSTSARVSRRLSPGLLTG